MTNSPTFHTRSVSYYGGSYNDAGTHYNSQMYVEHLVPIATTKTYPIIMIHGGGQSGTTWLNKPNGGMGWANWFLKEGYEVYIVDQPHTGRSPLSQDILADTRFIKGMTTKYIEDNFTHTWEDGRWPQSRLHSQWPGTGQKGDPYFDAYFASTSPFVLKNSKREEALVVAGTSLLDKIGPAIILTHSQGGISGWLWADARPNLVKALVQIEPKGPPYREELPGNLGSRLWGLTSLRIRYDPQPPSPSPAPLEMELISATSPNESDGWLQKEPARKLTNLQEIPILIETGEASYHAQYDHWTIRFLEQAGCEKVEHLKLADAGIHGNGHLHMWERNSDEIVALLEKWISKVV